MAPSSESTKSFINDALQKWISVTKLVIFKLFSLK
jgi:hypothetical protein